MKPDPDQPKNASTDYTPSIGAETDVARLGRTEPKPSHELTADEDAQVVNWNELAELSEFRELIKAKLRFIVPATLFFIVYYFALPLLVGYATEWVRKPILGVINFAYLFALSQKRFPNPLGRITDQDRQ